MPSLTLDIKRGGVLEERILEGVRDRVEMSKKVYANRHDKWIKAEEAALAYMPEREVDAARRSERDSDGKPHYTTMVIPYSYGILMASHTYWTTVFLSRSPVMQFAGRHGEGEQQIQAVEAYMDYQIQVGGMLVPFYIWLYDVGKYGLGIINNYWDEEENTISTIEEVDEMLLGVIKTGRKVKKKTSKIIKGYVGNKITNVRPYNFYPDPRVTLANFQRGEFCASAFELGWHDVLARRDAGYYIAETVARLGGKKEDGNWYGVDAVAAPAVGSGQLLMPSSETNYGEMTARKAADVVKGYESFINLVPSKWGLGKGEASEKWVFTVTSDFQSVLGAQPLGAFHNKYAYQVIELEPEGYSLTHRGLPEIVEPIQRTMDWLLNSHMYNVRKTLNNQFVVDPSRIVMKDVLQPQAGGVIRAKPQAYGQDIRTAISQLSVVDITRSHLADLEVMNGIGQRASGINDQILGMIGGGGGRKTATEVRTSSTFGINRLKTSAEYFSAMGWGPLAQMMVQNSQQYYEDDRKFKIVGDLASGAGPAFLQVTPEMISGFYDMMPVDGTLPVDRFAQASLWQQLFGQLRNMPEIGQQYDLAKMFGWVAQLAGLKNVNQFKIKPQMMGDEQVARQVQQGNLVPMGNRGPGAAGIPLPPQGPAGPSA